MSGPTQELPSWYTISTTILTDAAGVPTATSESLLYLPLTYYGPSIPLGSLWTYGGLTSPASTSPTETSTSATPTTSSVSSSSSLASMSPSSSLGPTSSSALPTPSASASADNGLSRNQLVGIIVGSIIGFIFLFVLLLLLYICCSNRRRRQNPRFSMVTPIEEDYYVVGAGGESPTEGSPRSSGEMEDSFLRRGPERKSVPATQQMSNVPPSGSGMGVVGAAQATHSDNSQNNSSVGSSSRSSNSAASGYGHEIPSALAAPEPFSQRWRGNILSREQLRRLDEESEPDPDETLVHTEHNIGADEKDNDAEILPLIPPPRLVDPDRSRSRLSQRSTPSHGSHLSVDPSEATVHTARRVRAEDLAPRSSPRDTSALPFDEEPVAGSSGQNRHDSGVWKGLGTWAAATGLARWFCSSNPSSRRNSSTLAWSSTPLGDNDLEQARTLLHNDPDNFHSPPPQMMEFRRTGSGIGLMATGDRPISSVSAKSGASTVYYDAYSAPGTPYGSRGTPLPTPPPRALANSSSAEMGYWTPPAATPGNSSSSKGAGPESGSGSGTTAQGVYQHPRQYDDITLSSIATVEGAHGLGPGDSGVDILDMPVPRGISPFASSSSLDKDTTTPNSSLGSSSAKKAGLKFPPGLGAFPLPTPTVWHETQGTTPSPGSFAAASRGGSTPHLPSGQNRMSAGDAGITIDVLEEAPPTAGAQWRTLAGSQGSMMPGFSFGEGRRTTFGMPHLVHQPYPDHMSEIGSLHSMRSHLSPHSSRSAGSAAASRRDASGSTGSNSSRPFGARSLLSSSEGSHSLSHSGSISSDGRKRNHKPGSGTMSPALSAFGHGGRGPSGAMSAVHGRFPTSPIEESVGERDASVKLVPGPGVTIDGSEDPFTSTSRSAPTSPRIGRSLSPNPNSQYDRSLSLSPIPWAAGLEDSWQPS